jgi:hypothetical protein
MMFRYGTTRYVLCVGGVAVKIPRIRIISWTNHFSMLKCLFAGISANLEEARLYRKCPHLPIAPTLFSLFGLVNIQTRAQPVIHDELVLCPFRELVKKRERLETKDLNKVEHFGRIDHIGICLLDYGNKKLNVLLDEVADSIQVVYEF